MTIWECRTVLGLVARLRDGRLNFRMGVFRPKADNFD
jgi:hypothetical protein